jgi:YYY domain-containing protein
LAANKRGWVYDLLLIIVLLGAAWFRMVGLRWDGIQHLHPDERFLTMVETALQPVPSLGEYFNTATSTLNPHNRGYGFYVYGDLPLLMVRYIAEWLGETGYDQVNIVGRQFSAIADLGVIFLIYLIASRLYGRKVGLLSAAFSAVTVMQIQQSHFFTTDNPANFFSFLAIAVAVLIADDRASAPAGDAQAEAPQQPRSLPTIESVLRDRLLWLSMAFGLAFGMALASKLSAAPMAVLLPAAFAVRYLQHRGDGRFALDLERLAIYLIAGGLVTVVAFRIFQPYAFLGVGLNPAWRQNISELQAQSNGNSDVPWALQWARRSHLFSLKNMVLWGFGLPLGVLAWAGFLWMAWRIFKREWKHALLWGWTAIYFIWQSMAFNPTMRYQLPIYPLLAMMAAWLVFNPPSFKRLDTRRLALGAGLLVLLLTTAWAFAFTRIYTRPHTRVAANDWIYTDLPGPITLKIQTGDGLYSQPLPFPYGASIDPVTPYISPFTANATGTLSEVLLPHVTALALPQQTLTLSILRQPDAAPADALATATVTDDFQASADGRGGSHALSLDQPVELTDGQPLFLRIEATGPLTLEGAAPINESSFDDGLPLRKENYDPFGGIYKPTLNMEMYYDDNADKVERFASTLEQGDYIFITSNRQFATIPRVPERYPLSTQYYRWLIGCPPGKDVVWCYNVATPGQFKGQLGYELVQVFESFPTLQIPGLLNWRVNDQFAEEAFTVYDHPKVLIFKKSADFNGTQVRAMLGSVDLSHVVHLTPGQASRYKFKDLNLPPDRLAQQRAGGTWSQLYSYSWLQNRYPALGLVIWYLFIFLLGLFTYPLVRLALPGLGAGAYGVSRVAGMALLAYLSWLAGSAGLSYSRSTIAVAVLVIVLAGLAVAWSRRTELRRQWDSERRLFLIIEILFLAFFVFDLLIRLGNPDLWHPSKGGERPMDFSYLNAVLKSTSFPPYDPWFAGGYINYYYYGYVLVGTPVKLLGIVPSIAYNMILPTLFAMVAIGAFTVGSQLLSGTLPHKETKGSLASLPAISGIAASLMTVVLGNLGTVRMIFQGFQRMAAPGGIIDDANVVQRWIWAVKGLLASFAGAGLPFGRGDWYWFPSRVIPAPGDVEPINEFPFFTFLYSDLHAHMIVLPLALFVLAWVVSVIKCRARMRPAEWLASFFAGGLLLGALYPTNLSDIYTYLLIAMAALGFVLWRWADLSSLPWLSRLPDLPKRLLMVAASLALLAGLSYALYEPYRYWYSQAYGAVDPWTGTHTPIWSYLTHWGLFLFIITAWLAWETRQWMAATPVSSLRKLQPYLFIIEGGLALLLAALLYMALKGVQVGWLALPLAAWAGLLLLRPDQPDEKRLVLFLTGTALLITIVVELVVVRGDIGRMNTVFKFYLQAWVLLAVSAAAAFGWLLAEIDQWRLRWRGFFQAGLYLLVAGAFLFTITATTDKISDRMATGAPHTLDSMTYMKYSTFWDGADMTLSQDYNAIRWLQDNVQGSPIIVEMNVPEYRWGTRFTIYTGLPGVVGWNFHQRQQRALLAPELVPGRVADVVAFYQTQDIAAAVDFLKRYDVRYIIVGQLERIQAPDGMAKFERYNDIYWHLVYHQDATYIYEVNE